LTGTEDCAVLFAAAPTGCQRSIMRRYYGRRCSRLWNRACLGPRLRRGPSASWRRSVDWTFEGSKMSIVSTRTTSSGFFLAPPGCDPTNPEWSCRRRTGDEGAACHGGDAPADGECRGGVASDRGPDRRPDRTGWRHEVGRGGGRRDDAPTWCERSRWVGCRCTSRARAGGTSTRSRTWWRGRHPTRATTTLRQCRTRKSGTAHRPAFVRQQIDQHYFEGWEFLKVDDLDWVTRGEPCRQRPDPRHRQTAPVCQGPLRSAQRRS